MEMKKSLDLKTIRYALVLARKYTLADKILIMSKQGPDLLKILKLVILLM